MGILGFIFGAVIALLLIGSCLLCRVIIIRKDKKFKSEAKRGTATVNCFYNNRWETYQNSKLEKCLSRPVVELFDADGNNLGEIYVRHYERLRTWRKSKIIKYSVRTEEFEDIAAVKAINIVTILIGVFGIIVTVTFSSAFK